MNEVGTLKDLDVKPGDVVELVYNGILEVDCKGEVDVITSEGKHPTRGANVRHKFRIISRANTPKLWRDMTDAEKGALLLAYHEGDVIEISNPEQGLGWVTGAHGFFWNDKLAYRIRPKPKIETVVIYGAQSNKWAFAEWRDGDDTHRITFNTINGKPDCASIKMEAI